MWESVKFGSFAGVKRFQDPNITQIINHRSMMKKTFQGVFAFEHIDAVETEAKKYLRSRKKFDALADDDPSQITLKVLNELSARHYNWGHDTTICLHFHH